MHQLYFCRVWIISLEGNSWKKNLVFFDDIQLYSKTWKEHLQLLDIVLEILEQQTLLEKESKCEFGITEILYMGHIISAHGVQVDQNKI